MNINSNYTIRLGNRNIVKIMKGSTVIWEKSTTPVVTPDYLYIQNTYAGTNDITFTKPDDENTKTLEYSKDLSNWTSFTPEYETTYKVTLNQGEKLYLRGSNGTRPNLEIWGQRSHIAGGNVNTLLDYTNPNGVSLPQEAFKSLFGGDLYLTDASNLVLPATRLSNYCYSYMFYTCSSLTTAPTLSATTLAPHCYDNMFGGCRSLTTAPELPATTLAENCYAQMFYHSTSLTTAPELPATTLAQECYSNMFNGCTSLNSVTIYANDISATDCLDNWLGNVAATGTFYNNGSATYVTNSASGIPTGWTEVKPVNADYFYIKNVSSGSTNNLNYKFTGTPSSDTIEQIEYSYDKQNWTTVILQGGGRTNVLCSFPAGGTVYLRNSNGKFNTPLNYLSFKSILNHEVGGDISTLLDYTNQNVSLPGICTFFRLFESDTGLVRAGNLTLGFDTLTNNCFALMFKGCSNLTTAPTTLPATTVANDCYAQMFYNCRKLTTAPTTLPATTVANDCYNQMFYNCSLLTTAPELPATTVAQNCYSEMFFGCNNLTTAPTTLPATTLVYGCYKSMFQGCTSLTTAPSLPATTLAGYCYGWMFNGCTSLTTAPSLPATTLVSNCYFGMFQDCTSLNSVTIYADDISEGGCLNNWLQNVAATGTFHNLGSATYPTDSASGIPQGWTEVKPTNYFYIKNVDNQSGNVSFKFYGTPSSDTIQQIEWSKDRTNWTPVTLVTNTTTNVPVSVGEKVYFRNSNGKCSNSNRAFLNFSSDINTNIGGELYTLLVYTDENVALPQFAFVGLFYQMDKLKNASGLVLRWTTLTDYCYWSMFQGCSSLRTAPSLPATILATGCYSGMFLECNLTTAPALPATTLAPQCYYSMFQGCTSLTTAPSLPATNLATGCYTTMFSECISLTTAPSLPATTLADSCYKSMFEGCINLTTAPSLPATTLADSCYTGMFYSCINLNSVTIYADDISASGCLNNWLHNVAAAGTFHNLGGAIYPTDSASGIPQGWTEVYS